MRLKTFFIHIGVITRWYKPRNDLCTHSHLLLYKYFYSLFSYIHYAFLGYCEVKTAGGRGEINEIIITKNHQHKIYSQLKYYHIHNYVTGIRGKRGLLPRIVLH